MSFEHVLSVRQIQSEQAQSCVVIPRHKKTANVIIAVVAEGACFMAILQTLMFPRDAPTFSVHRLVGCTAFNVRLRKHLVKSLADQK